MVDGLVSLELLDALLKDLDVDTTEDPITWSPTCRKIHAFFDDDELDNWLGGKCHMKLTMPISMQCSLMNWLLDFSYWLLIRVFFKIMRHNDHNVLIHLPHSFGTGVFCDPLSPGDLMVDQRGLLPFEAGLLSRLLLGDVFSWGGDCTFQDFHYY